MSIVNLENNAAKNTEHNDDEEKNSEHRAAKNNLVQLSWTDQSIKNRIKAQNEQKVHESAPSLPNIENTWSSSQINNMRIPFTQQPTKISSNLFDTIRQRNQYVFNGTLPHEVIRERLAAYLNKNKLHSAADQKEDNLHQTQGDVENQKEAETQENKVIHNSLFDTISTLQTVLLYKQVINLATNNLALAEKIIDRIEVLLPDLETNSNIQTNKKYLLLKNIHNTLHTMVKK